jgi:LacI family transcriptional regulator
LKKDQRTSMREVSRLSGVSIATVSRVIHKSGRFSAATERRVREVMERLDYKPDVVAQGMRMRSMPIVGIILPDIMDENYALMVRTLQTELFQNGYSVSVFNTNEDGTLARYFVGMLKTQRASGILYIPDRNGEAADMEGLPTVFFDRRPKGPQPERSVVVECDNFGGARRAVSRLIAGGRRRIALLSDEKNVSSHRERIRGYRAALEEAGLQPGPTYLVDPQRTTEAIAALNGAFDNGVPFDSIFCTSIRLTIGALTVLHGAGIPREQTQVLGFGEHRLHRYGLLPYLAVREPIVEMSAAAARELLNLMAGGEPAQTGIVLPLTDAADE